jgi:cytochrome c553
LVSSALTIALTLKLKQLTDTMTRFTLLTALAAAALAPALAAAQTPAPAGDPMRGAQKVQMCQGCHGILGWRTAYPEVYRVPKIAGQHPAYIVAALKEYKAGQRSHPSMDAIAASLSDQDMADVAAYYSQAPLQTAVK